jgi:NAD(P)H-nitrite reductase large subunit
VLKKIFGVKRDAVPEGWRQLHKGGFHNFYTSLNIIRVIKIMRMGNTGIEG